ncbi:MAG: hypothetical protein GKR89_17755 [Candidatus Latescibacteria bacterium]|nr:hypothetical protein [Candidatus Latescibacterota bacterium]
MSQSFSAAYLQRLGSAVFQAYGAPGHEADHVAQLLVQADLMGLPSHGLLRLPQYVGDMGRGVIVPGAELLVRPASPTGVQVDAQWNFGQVGATRAVELAVQRARELGVGCASLRRCRHVGRLGAYTEMAAAQNCLALATCSTAGEGHWVAPFGGRQGRLGTNPLSFAAPTSGRPVVLDFSTAALPEGKVRFYRDTGQSLPSGSLVDQVGGPSSDPDDLYAADGTPAGAILPFGGPQGYKGFGLGFMVQILSSLVGEPTWREEGDASNANTMWLMVIDVGAWMETDRFKDELDEMVAYMRSAAPAQGSTGVLVPGQREFDLEALDRRQGIPIEDGVWEQIVAVAQTAGVSLEAA